MSLLRTAALAASTLALAACQMPPTVASATLYPANKPAEKKGPQTMVFTFSGWSGPVSMVTKNGEAFNGQYTMLNNAVSGYGTSTAYTGYRYYPVATGTSSMNVTPGMVPGTAALMGSKGGSANCDFNVNRSRPITGSGTCKLPGGAEYKMMF